MESSVHIVNTLHVDDILEPYTRSSAKETILVFTLYAFVSVVTIKVKRKIAAFMIQKAP